MATFLQIVFLIIAVVASYKLGRRKESRAFKVTAEMTKDRLAKEILELKDKLTYKDREIATLNGTVKDLELDRAAINQVLDKQIEKANGLEQKVNELLAPKPKKVGRPRKLSAHESVI